MNIYTDLWCACILGIQGVFVCVWVVNVCYGRSWSVRYIQSVINADDLGQYFDRARGVL